MKFENKTLCKIKKLGNCKSLFLGFGFLIFGFVLLLIKGFSVEYVDAQGFLHENFFLLPLGFLFVFLGICYLIILLMKNLVIKFKNII